MHTHQPWVTSLCLLEDSTLPMVHQNSCASLLPTITSSALLESFVVLYQLQPECAGCTQLLSISISRCAWV